MKFKETKCAICGTYGNSRKVFKSRLDDAVISKKVFSARRIPDRRSYQWVRCNECGLLRSDPVLDVDLSILYGHSSFDYSSEVEGLKETYRRIVLRALNSQPVRGALLEIGGGSGFFLEVAKEMGFSEVKGIEPSADAVATARDDIKPLITIGMLDSSYSPKEKFDVIVMFHVMDHLTDPKEAISICRRALKSGGTLIVAVHNSSSWSARLLKSYSPIVDVEHTYLYDFTTGRDLFREAEYSDIQVGSYANRYSVHYLIQLVPFPKWLKRRILRSSVGKILIRIRIWIPLGNMWISGKKP